MSLINRHFARLSTISPAHLEVLRSSANVRISLVHVATAQTDIFSLKAILVFNNQTYVHGLRITLEFGDLSYRWTIRMDFVEHATGVNFCHGLLILVFYSFS